MEAIWLVLFAIACTCTAGGILIGHKLGVKETEERWSDAVAKAEWARKYGA
jgi:hypothetical protein